MSLTKIIPTFLVLILQILLLPLRLVKLFIKPEEVWLLGAWVGKKYDDNPKHLFEYLNKKNEKAVFLTRSQQVYDHLKAKGFNVAKFYSLKSLIYGFKAKYLVMSVSYDDLDFFAYLFPKNKIIVNLWHGSPLKNVMNQKRPLVIKIVRSTIIKYLGRNFDIVFTASELFVKHLKEYFNIPEKNFVIEGYPRNDVFFNKPKKPAFLENLNYKKIVLLAPTFREYEDDKDWNIFDRYQFLESKILDYCQDEDVLFLVNLHFRDILTKNLVNKMKKKYPVEKYPNLIFLTEEMNEGSIYNVMPYADILMTDYSGIFYDYLLANKPVVFLPFDFDKYTEHRGFYFDYYNEITFGYRSKNWIEAKESVQEIIEKGDLYIKERGKVQKLTNANITGNYTELTYQKIKKFTR